MNLLKRITTGVLAFAMVFTMTFAIVPPMKATAETGTVTLNFPADGPYCNFYEVDGVTPIAAGSAKTIPTMAAGESYSFIVVPKLGYAINRTPAVDYTATPDVVYGTFRASPAKLKITIKNADTDGTVVNFSVRASDFITTAQYASEAGDYLDNQLSVAESAIDKLPVDTYTKESLKSPLAGYVSAGKAAISDAGNDPIAITTALANALSGMSSPINECVFSGAKEAAKSDIQALELAQADKDSYLSAIDSNYANIDALKASFDNEKAKDSDPYYIADLNATVALLITYGYLDSDLTGIKNTLDAAYAQANYTYQLVEGADSTWTIGSNGTLTIKSLASFHRFQKVFVDDQLVDASNYTAIEGSTIIKFKSAYLNTLSIGKHSVAVVWSDGTASTTLTVAKGTTPAKGGDGGTPATGDTTDTSDVAGWTMLLLLSIAGIFATGALRMRKENK